MQNFELIVMQRVELVTFPCMPARPSQLDEAAKALHAMRVFVFRSTCNKHQADGIAAYA
jgi:hypothetical protein